MPAAVKRLPTRCRISGSISSGSLNALMTTSLSSIWSKPPKPLDHWRNPSRSRSRSALPPPKQDDCHPGLGHSDPQVLLAVVMINSDEDLLPPRRRHVDWRTAHMSTTLVPPCCLHRCAVQVMNGHRDSGRTSTTRTFPTSTTTCWDRAFNFGEEDVAATGVRPNQMPPVLSTTILCTPPPRLWLRHTHRPCLISSRTYLAILSVQRESLEQSAAAPLPPHM